MDPKDHIWILHRPSGLTDGERAASLTAPAADCGIPAPQVIEFDQAGRLLQAWGGPGDGCTWPHPGGEHGLSVDHKGHVNLTNAPLRYYEGVTTRPIQEECHRSWATFGLKFNF